MNSSQGALGLAQRLLTQSEGGTLATLKVLRELAEGFGAEGAGLVEASGASAGLRQRLRPGEPALPWTSQPILLLDAADSPSPTLLEHEGHRFLCCPAGADRVLWLEAPVSTSWTAEEQSALAVVGLALAQSRARTEPADSPRTGQVRLEDAVLVARRLAHIYSNVLTSIFGFVEMGLTQAPANSALKRYLDVAFRGAQQGVALTQRLRLLGCKATASAVGASLPPVLARSLGRRSIPGRDVEEILDLPADLPPLALSTEQLTAVLDSLLDNAHEALEPAGGKVLISARLVQPTEEEVRETWGRMARGVYLRLDVTDSGPGMGADARARLFRQPFFTSKPRHHGLGLTIVHSIVSSQQGGLCLIHPPAGGLTARVFLPTFNPTASRETHERRTR